jgi:hypothetical protein
VVAALVILEEPLAAASAALAGRRLGRVLRKDWSTKTVAAASAGVLFKWGAGDSSSSSSSKVIIGHAGGNFDDTDLTRAPIIFT